MWLLWDWMGIEHWEFHGMALWSMLWCPMGLHWGWSLRIPWQCSMGRSLGCPHVTPMELPKCCSIGAPWKCLMGSTSGFTHVASLGLDGVCSLGNSPCLSHKALPWCSYGAMPMQFHGSSIWTSQWHTHRALRVEFPTSSTQCKSMESHCITHRTIPWNSQ